MQEWQDLFTTSQDGLRLYARRYGSCIAPKTPVICLPGLTRTTADFHEAAVAISSAGERAVYAFDYRGRGRSDFDPDWRNYDVKIELSDVLDQMTALQIPEAIFFGTSRGGMITMLVPILRPAAIKGAILNDVGPVLDGKGLARIRNYVGKIPQPGTFAEGAAIIKRISSTQFPNLDDAGWERQARRSWVEKDGKLVPAYDTRIMKTLELIDLEQPLPTLWPQFEALSHIPVLVLRGAHSDILSPQTAVEMTKRHPRCALYTVDYEGHAPLLADAPTLDRVTEFVAAIA